MARSDSGRGAALWSAAQPARGGGSQELAVYSAPDLSFRRGFHLRHLGDVENLLFSPWEDDGQQWRLVWVGRLNANSTSMAVGSGAPLAKLRAPAWVVVFGDPSGMVDSAWAVAHQRCSELHMAARVLTIADQNSP
jgi:hypothetical protein